MTNNLPVEQKTNWALNEVVLPSDTNGWGTAINQLTKAIPIYSACGDYYTATYTSNTYNLTPVTLPDSTSNVTVSQYIDGMTVSFICPADNLANSSINVNALGSKSIKSITNISLPAGKLKSGCFVQLQYDSANNCFKFVQDITKQDTLVSGQNIKTINNESILGSGDLSIYPRSIGEIVPSILPLTDSKLHLLDGTLIQDGGSYSDFVDYIGDLYNAEGILYNIWSSSNSNLFVKSLTAGQQTVYDENGVAYSSSEYAATVSFREDTYNVVITILRNGSLLGTTYRSENVGNGDILPTGFITEDSWQSTVTTYGSCGKFVYSPEISLHVAYSRIDVAGSPTVYVTRKSNFNTPGAQLYNENDEVVGRIVNDEDTYQGLDGNGYYILGYYFGDPNNPIKFYRNDSKDFEYAPSVRLPKISDILQGTTDVTALGTLVEAGLPNITGEGDVAQNGNASNCIRLTSYGGNLFDTSASGGWGHAGKLIIDASRSSSIYGNSNTVQPQTIKVLYYIVVGTTTKTPVEVDIDEIATDLNGKADVDLTNVNNTGTSRGASWAMPSNTYDTLTLGAAGTTYTAPANGWFILDKNAGTNNSYVALQNTTTGILFVNHAPMPASRCTAYIPAKKGDVVGVDYTASGTTNLFRFIYAVGSESEAS